MKDTGSVSRAWLAGLMLLSALAGGGGALLIKASDDEPPKVTTVTTIERVGTSPDTQPDGASPERRPRDQRRGSREKSRESEDQPDETSAAPDATSREQPPKEATAEAPPQADDLPQAQQQQPRPPSTLTFPPPRTFSGVGNEEIGTIIMRQAALLRWTSGGDFQLRYLREGVPAVLTGGSGTINIPPDTYESVRVVAGSRWRIRLAPSSVASP